jgi:hypothetical protein
MPAIQQVPRPIDRFEDDEARSWIWIRDADRHYKIAFSDLALWLTAICPWIGKKLHPCQWWPGPFGKDRRYVLENEVKAIREAMDHECKVTHPPADPDVLSLAEIEKRCPAGTRGFLLYAYRNPERCPADCRLWSDELAAYDAAGKKREKLRHMRLSQVEKLLEASPKTKTPDLKPYTDLLGNVWIPPKLSRQWYGVGKERLIKAVKLKHKALDRRIRFLKPEDVPAEYRANRHTRYYLADDCRRIGEWLKRPSKKEKATVIIDTAVASGPIDCRLVYAKAKKEGISPRTVNAALRMVKGVISTRVGNRGGTTYWHKRNQRLPAAPSVSIPHPRLDVAIKFLTSIPNREEMAWPELERRAKLEGIPRTTLRRAHEALRRSDPDGSTLGTPTQPENRAESQPNASHQRTEHYKYPGHVKKPYRTGRKHIPEREPVLQFCYDEYVVKGQPRQEVLERAKTKYGQAYAPRADTAVKPFAHEWSERFNPPLPMERDTASAKFLMANE